MPSRASIRRGISPGSVFPMLVLAFTWLACGGSPAEIRLGVLVPFERNPGTVEGATLAADEINAGGGLSLGSRPARLTLVVHDSESRPEAAVSSTLFLVHREEVVGIIGLTMSLNAIPVAEMAERLQVPVISTLSSHPATTLNKRYTFRLNLLNEFQARAMARFAREDLGIRTIAVMTQIAGQYSVDLSESFMREFEGYGGEVVAFESFIEDAFEEVGEQLTAIRESGAEAVYMPYQASIVRRHMRQLREMGVESIFLGGDTWNTIAVGDEPLIGPSYFIDIWSPDIADVRVTSFVDAYRRRFDTTPTTSAALAYDAVHLMAAAMRAGQSADPPLIRDALATLGAFEGVTGVIRFNGTGDPNRTALIRMIDEDGQLQIYKEIAP